MQLFARVVRPGRSPRDGTDGNAETKANGKEKERAGKAMEAKANAKEREGREMRNTQGMASPRTPGHQKKRHLSDVPASDHMRPVSIKSEGETEKAKLTTRPETAKTSETVVGAKKEKAAEQGHMSLITPAGSSGGDTARGQSARLAQAGEEGQGDGDKHVTLQPSDAFRSLSTPSSRPKSVDDRFQRFAAMTREHRLAVFEPAGLFSASEF